MANTTEKRGCTCQPTQCPTHGGTTVQDWMQYIDSYMDVRARQIYDKLKGLGVSSSCNSSGGNDTTIRKAVYLKDRATGDIYEVYIEDGNQFTRPIAAEDIPTEEDKPTGGCGCHCGDPDNITINNYLGSDLEFEDLVCGENPTEGEGEGTERSSASHHATAPTMTKVLPLKGVAARKNVVLKDILK